VQAERESRGCGEGIALDVIDAELEITDLPGAPQVAVCGVGAAIDAP